MNATANSVRGGGLSNMLFPTLLAIAFLFGLSNPGMGAEGNGIWNVKEGRNPAVGNGIHDDTPAIQARIDSAYNDGGGIVFFPAGNYLVTGTILLHSRVYLEGVGGSTFGGDGFDPGYNPENFEDSLGCRITLAAGHNVDIIRTDTNFYQSGVEDIALVGNMSGAAGPDIAACRGIYIPDTRSHYRSEAKFRNVIIYGTRGTGFYDGTNQYEIDLSYVEVIRCGGDGFVLKGPDNKVERCGAGWNKGSGFLITAGGAGRFYDVDSWNNGNNGLEIHDVENVFFFGIQANNNGKCGVEIGPGVSSSSYTPSEIEFYRGYFSDNSVADSDKYPDVYLYSLPGSNQWGPGHILFNGCEFLGFTRGGHPAYPIYDASVNVQRNLVSDCDFWASHYVHYTDLQAGTAGANQAYQFRDCMLDDSAGLGVYSTNSMKVVTTSSGFYQITPWDGFINASAASNNVVISLPDINQVQMGAVFYVSRSDKSGNAMTVGGWKGQKIDGKAAVPVIGSLTTLMITRVGDQWRAVEMTPP